jgi:hypothetical protein
MKVCPQCQREYPDQSTFCRQDGAALVGQVAVASPITADRSEQSESAPTTIPLPPPNGSQQESPRKVSDAARSYDNPLASTPEVCRKCRKPLGVDDPFCASCGTPTTTAQALCPHCGQQHPATQRFCPKTGQSIRATPLQRAGKTPLFAVLAGLAALLLLLGIYFGVRHSQQSASVAPASGTTSNASITGSVPASTNPTSSPPASAPSVLPPPVKPLQPATLPVAAVPLPSQSPPPVKTTPLIQTFTDGVANASSFEAPHVPRLAFDGDQSTIWHTEEYQNAWISVKYPTPRHVTQISIIGGSLRQFYESARLKDVRLRFSNGETQTLHLDDVQQMQTRKLSPPILTNSIQFELVGLYPGKTMHIIVPEIVVRGYEQ